MRTHRAGSAGFTLIELLLVISIIGLISVIALIGQHNATAVRRDVKRLADAKSLQSGLALYLAKVGSYPSYTGCVDGTAGDAVTTGLRAQGLITSTARFADPLNPSDTTKCYYYTQVGASYTLRYTLEQTSNAGTAGNVTIVP